MLMETDTITMEADQDGNFDSPVLQSLYDVCEAYEIQEIEEAEVRQALDAVEKLTRTQIQEMEADAKRPDVDVHDPDRVTILMAFQAHLEGLDKMRLFFKTGEADLIDQGFDIIHEATNRMMDGLHGLLESDQETAPKLCVMCSEPNEQQATICSNCNAKLPIDEKPSQSRLISVEGPETESEGQTTTPNYIEISEAHEAWSEERLSAEQFLAIAEKIRANHLADHEEACSKLQECEEDDEEAATEREHLEQLTAVLVQNVQAVELLIQALLNDDEQGVEDAMFAIADATVAILEFAPQPAHLTE